MIDKTQSQTIDLLRFPLTVFVVLIHTKTLNIVPLNEAVFPFVSETGIYNATEILLQRALPIIAVPTFFFISGFLFFQKLDKWNWNIYKSKIKSRARTLLIPYVCWITLSYVLVTDFSAMAELLDNSTFSEAFVTIRRSIRKAYWDNLVTFAPCPNWAGLIEESSYPLVAPLWFLRDLMVVTVLSPAFYFFLKKLRFWGLLFLAFCYISGIWPVIHGFSIMSFFFFGMGCYLAINKLSIVCVARKLRHIALPTAIIALCLLTYYCAGETSIGTKAIPFYTIAGVWSALWISSHLVAKHNLKPNRFLVSSCFFVYALHMAPHEGDKGLLSEICDYTKISLSGIPHTELLIYIIPPILTIAISLIVYCIVQRFSPRLCALLTGNR